MPSGKQGGGAPAPMPGPTSDIPPSPADIAKQVQKKLGDANTKWRDLKAGFEEVNNNIVSFYRWLLNTDENGYDAFKTTYTATWLKKFTDFEGKSRQDLDAIRAVIDEIIEKEGGFSEEKKNGYKKTLAQALDDDTETGRGNLASQYKNFINKVSNLYDQTKAFFGKYETLVSRNNKLLEAQRAQGQGRYGQVQAPIAIQPITFILPLELVDNFAEVIHEAVGGAAKIAERNVERATKADEAANSEYEKKKRELVDLGTKPTGDDKKAAEWAAASANVAAALAIQQSAAKEVKTAVSAEENYKSGESGVKTASSTTGAAKVVPKPIVDSIGEKSEKFDALFKEVGGGLKARSSPALALTANDNLFAKILNDYLTTKDLQPDAEFTAREKLVETLHANQLVPNQVLKVNKMDKVVFVFLTLFMRLLGLTLIEYLIEKGKIKTITAATFGFFGLYSLMFVAFTMMVNVDLYRLRIVFNMLNMHANGGYVYMHLGLLWLFGGFIYMVLTNLNVFNAGVKITAINEYEKQVLISKLELLTLIVWTLLTIVVVLS